MYGVEPLEALKKIKHQIVFTHFKSLKHVGSKKIYCRLSEGEIDYLPILKQLSKTYNGFYAIEYEETADVFEGSENDLKTLKELIEQI
jgi:sugar phosphate isomerase/epimerase